MSQNGNPLLWVVGFLVALTAAALGAVGVHGVRAAGDASMRAGLDYHTFMGAVDDLIRDAGDASLVRFDMLEERLPDGTVAAYDTMVVVADTLSFPAFRRGGFLHDQVQAYNRFQRDRVALAREEPGWFHRLQAHNPSVFRSRWTGEETPRLTRSSVPWSLRVRSPAEEEWDGEIRARDVHRGSGLVGPRTTVPLRRHVRLTRRVHGRRQLCEFTPTGVDVRAYCLSEERIPQAILRLATDERADGSLLAGWNDLWVDGRRVSSGDSVPLGNGAVLGIDPLEPVVFGEYWEGILSSKQWISGRMRRRSVFAPPLDLFSALGDRASSAEGGASRSASVQLTVDADASRELTESLSGFLEDVPLPLDFGIIVIGRIDDGEILAIAEVGNRRSRGRSNLLERVTPGSAVKPLLAAAVLSRRPELGTLRIPARSGRVSSVLGLPPAPDRRAFRTELNCGPPQSGWIDLAYHLRCSNNEYGASLLVAGLWDGEGLAPSGTGRFSLGGRTVSGSRPSLTLQGGQVSRATLLRSDVSEGLSRLFDVPTDPAIADSLGRSRRVWQGLRFSDGRAVEVPHELLPSESRPALLAPSRPEGTDLSLLYRYGFGAWENQWNLLDLTTGFARVVTDQRVQLRFAPAAGGEADGARWEDLGLRGLPWYPRFLEGLRGVAVDGTAAGLGSAWRGAGLPRALLAKTGTLAEPGEAGRADDLFLKSLLFAVGEEAAGDRGRLRCGLVGGIYLRFQEGPDRGRLPSYQVRFAERELGRILARRWEDFAACPPRGGS
jgi:hypothetical protein